MEMVFTLFFTVELLMRYCATRQTDTPFWPDPYVWFDFVAIMPFYLICLICVGNPFSDDCDLRSEWSINVLQAFKILRVFKISRVRARCRCLPSPLLTTLRRSLGLPAVPCQHFRGTKYVCRRLPPAALCAPE